MNAEARMEMVLLVREADLIVYAYRNSTGGFLLFPPENFDPPERLKAATMAAEERGFKWVAILALLKRTLDGRPWLDYVRVPGTDENDIEAAMDIWRDQLMREGILKPDAVPN